MFLGILLFASSFVSVLVVRSWIVSLWGAYKKRVKCHLFAGSYRPSLPPVIGGVFEGSVAKGMMNWLASLAFALDLYDASQVKQE